MMVSVQRVFEGTVFQAKVMEEKKIGMRGQGYQDILVEEARMIFQEELRATEVVPDLKVISFEAKMLTGGINNKGFLDHDSVPPRMLSWEPLCSMGLM